MFGDKQLILRDCLVSQVSSSSSSDGTRGVEAAECHGPLPPAGPPGDPGGARLPAGSPDPGGCQGKIRENCEEFESVAFL